jgi:hypothetical protein
MFANGDELPRISDFTALGADFVDVRNMTKPEHSAALVEFGVLYAGHVAETLGNPNANRACEGEECQITAEHIELWQVASAADPSTPPFDRWVRQGNVKGFRNTNLGLASFVLYGHRDGELVGFVHGDNVRVESEDENLISITTRLFTVWKPTPLLTRVERDAKMQRWLLENNLQTPPIRKNIDIVEIRHYRGNQTGIDSNRHPAYDVEFWPEFVDVADEIQEPEDEQVGALRRKNAGPRPPPDPDAPTEDELPVENP